ncbi:right-handed parallel beta-helix repeat-containing protein [Flavivirga sp. Y03]|uniref:Right-handed parallel beta-helix repeat-containing protein n=2 Tax=Flavivirga algicola TaxID=2729136 RepID=A0ABX1RUI2_9FLAO|nr:right-handed parallel beta-helix repeat-containing protein [Flavivirga algicola]
MSLGLSLFLLNTGCFAKKIKAESVFFNNSIKEDATSAVLHRILDAGDKPISEIKFEKGTYHFYPDKGLEQFCYISNHNDVVIKTAFPIFNMKNLVIDGQGSTFIFHGKMIPFLIDMSQNITLKNLNIDWEIPFHSEGLVVSSDLKNRTFDLKISDAYPYEIRNEQLYFIKESYEHNLGQAILYDPERKAIAYDTESYTPLTLYHHLPKSEGVVKNSTNYKYKLDPIAPSQRVIGREFRLSVKEIEPGLIRIFNHGKKIPPVGKILVCKGEQHLNRLAPAIRLTGTYGFKATNVNIHHAGGMGVIAENSADLILDNVNVTPSHGRMVSTTADATHFVGCRGKVELKNCTFNNQLDDATNVHGTYQEVIDLLGENTIGVRMGHFQQQGFVIGKTNDTIGFVRLSKSFFPYDKLTIKSTKRFNSRYQIITFNEALPKNLEPGDLIENLSGYPEVLVENCNISRNRARGLLLSSPKETIIRNNFFSTEMEALLIPVESGHWYESGNGSNITVENNVFQDCNHSGYDRGVIRFVTDDDNENIAFNNIKIKGNTFNHFDNLVLEIANTNNLEFSNNTISLSKTFPKLFNQDCAIMVKSSKNIEFKNNTYKGEAPLILETEKDMPKLTFN